MRTMVVAKVYRLYVSECFLASKGGVPNKNSKQRMPRLHTSTPASCSFPSTESKQAGSSFQVSSWPHSGINWHLHEGKCAVEFFISTHVKSSSVVLEITHGEKGHFWPCHGKVLTHFRRKIVKGATQSPAPARCVY